MSERHYYRCHDCLSVVMVDQSPRGFLYHYGNKYPVCGLCGGRLDYMGEVRRATPKTLTHAVEVCKCNELCVSARGPNCSCACNGEHHGVGLATGYEIVHTAVGRVPRVTVPDSAKSREVVREWREALAKFDAEYRPLADAYDRREWLGPERFRRYLDLKRARFAAVTAKTQAARLKALAVGLRAMAS